jgi:hypothetical protein
MGWGRRFWHEPVETVESGADRWKSRSALAGCRVGAVARMQVSGLSLLTGSPSFLVLPILCRNQLPMPSHPFMLSR